MSTALTLRTLGKKVSIMRWPTTILTALPSLRRGTRVSHRRLLANSQRVAVSEVRFLVVISMPRSLVTGSQVATSANVKRSFSAVSWRRIALQKLELLSNVRQGSLVRHQRIARHQIRSPLTANQHLTNQIPHPPTATRQLPIALPLTRPSHVCSSLCWKICRPTFKVHHINATDSQRPFVHHQNGASTARQMATRASSKTIGASHQSESVETNVTGPSDLTVIVATNRTRTSHHRAARPIVTGPRVLHVERWDLPEGIICLLKAHARQYAEQQ